MLGIFVSSASDSGGRLLTTSNAVCKTSVQIAEAKDGSDQLCWISVNKSLNPVLTPEIIKKLAQKCAGKGWALLFHC